MTERTPSVPAGDGPVVVPDVRPLVVGTRSAGDIANTVSPGMRIAAAWSWRFLAVAGALALFLYIIGFVSEITIPVAIALLLNALLNPVRQALVNKGMKRSLAAALVFVGGLLLVGGIITLVVRQFISGATDLADQVSAGLDKIQNWLVTGPLKLSQEQINSAVTSVKESVVENKDALTSGAVNTASSAGHVITGFVLVLFILFFFLRDGRRIWNWILGLAPQRAKFKINEAAELAWTTLGGYVRATVLVAFVDAVGIGIGLFAVGVPLAIPLTAFVFLASFIPIIGALLSGVVAVLVALVTLGPIQALIILAVVILVQQLEGHVLQPILLGRAVSLHPLGVALSIAAGVILIGITGALLAVPIVACLNASIKYLSRSAPPPSGQSSAQSSAEDLVAGPAAGDSGHDPTALTPG